MPTRASKWVGQTVPHPSCASLRLYRKGNEIMCDTTKARSLLSGLILLASLLMLSAGWFRLPPVRAQAVPPPVCPPRTILFVAATQPLPPEDQPLADYLSVLGHQLVIRTARNVQASDAVGKELVIISESSLSTEINARLSAIAVPILTWDGWLLDDLKMAGPQEYIHYGDLFTTTLTIADSQHPLAGGLSGQVQTTQRIDEFHWGNPGPHAAVVAITQQPAHAYIFAYEAGAPMVGLTAPARRVFIHNATGPLLTANGWTLFDAAVRWTSNCPTSPIPTNTPTNTPVPPTNTATNTPTNTSVPSTNTATNTPTNTPVPPTPSNTSTPTSTPTNVAVETVTNLPSSTATPTPTTTSTHTVAPLPTDTPTASATSSSTATNTPTATLSPTSDPSDRPSPTATATPTATTVVASGPLLIAKRDFLFADADNNNLVSPGDTLLYTIQVVNRGTDTTPRLRLADGLDPNTQLVAGAVRIIGGVVVQGNDAADEQVIVEITPLIGGASATMSLQARVTANTQASQLENQAVVTFVTAEGQPSDQPPLFSDDPDTGMLDDATITPLMDLSAQPRSLLFLPLVGNEQP
jgi:hypothetical protein